ncbi:MAG TPA: glycosyltransferase, partial [Alphaproteobacteria bacterium]|nr:glycosyltransferase [Alphaproteobacteria bacterium]
MIKPLNFLFTTWEGGGNVTPALEVVRKLGARGHRVRFMSDECNRPEAEANGASFVHWTRAPNRQTRDAATEVIRDWAAATPEEAMGGIMRDLVGGKALDYAQDTIDELRREAADLVVTCELTIGVFAACESVGQRFA